MWKFIHHQVYCDRQSPTTQLCKSYNRYVDVVKLSNNSNKKLYADDNFRYGCVVLAFREILTQCHQQLTRGFGVFPYLVLYYKEACLKF